MLYLISSYLHERKQSVVIDGCNSELADINSGVPQGSILGPLLFLVYVNDLPLNIDCKINLFADDTIIWEVILDKSISVEHLNNTYKRLAIGLTNGS